MTHILFIMLDPMHYINNQHLVITSTHKCELF